MQSKPITLGNIPGVAPAQTPIARVPSARPSGAAMMGGGVVTSDGASKEMLGKMGKAPGVSPSN